jgi:hypothetical protein
MKSMKMKSAAEKVEQKNNEINNETENKISISQLLSMGRLWMSGVGVA